MTESLNQFVAAKAADVCGSACPGPLLEAKRAIGSEPAKLRPKRGIRGAAAMVVTTYGERNNAL